MLSDRAPAASNARTGCIWKAAPENILLTPAINADDRPHVMVMRHDHHMRTPDYVQDAQFIGSVKLPDSGALWLAGCIEQGCRLGDGGERAKPRDDGIVASEMGLPGRRSARGEDVAVSGCTVLRAAHADRWPNS